MTDSGLSDDEWGVVERLTECNSLADELDGLDAKRFLEGVEALQEQVFALPTKRALAKQPMETYCVASIAKY